MAEIKGALLKAWISFLNERYGAQAVQRATAGLNPSDRALLATQFLDSSWYPYDTLHSLRRLTRPLVTSGDGDLAPAIGRHMAQQVFTGVYKSLLVGDPIKQVQKFAWISEFFFRETRKLETEITGAQSCVVRYRYEGGANPTRAICASLLGFWSRTLELAGARNLKGAHTKCVAEGASCCEFVLEWQPEN
jgi:predicted hydrocarbon binding protein